MKELTFFINNELKPRLWDNIPSIFPDMNFELRGGKWQSQKHADGSEGTGDKKDRSVITPRCPYRIYDNTRQESVDIIEAYKNHARLSETWEAVLHLCDIVGISHPEYSEEQKQIYRKAEERRSELELSAERQAKALFSLEGKLTLDYLLSRGWTEAEIREAKLGYISKAEASQIKAQYGIGDIYTLSIPLRTGSQIYGFKFRKVNEQAQGDKYVYLQGTAKKGNLFNLTGIAQKNGRIIVVEGELDALHASVKGIDGVVATSGGGLTDELLEVALQRGIKYITLLFDKDERGEKFILDSLRIAHKKGVSVLVAQFPEETLANGKRIHDVDEYLSAHTKEELETLINKAQRGGEYLIDELINRKLGHLNEGEQLTDKTEVEVRKEFMDIASQIPDITERELAIVRYCRCFDGYISVETMKRYVQDWKASNTAYKQKELEKSLDEATRLLKEGKLDEALNAIEQKASSIKKIEDAEKYSHLLTTDSYDSFLFRMQNRPEEIKTQYELTNPSNNEKEPLSLPSGAITFIVAVSSHGKSTMLQNIALQVAQGEEDGAVLYFSFEEDKDSVVLQLCNKYVNKPLSNNNQRTLNSYFRTGNSQYFKDNAFSTFQGKGDEFFSKYISSGKLRVYYEDYDSTELIRAIRTISAQIKVKAVFIDYIQLLSKRGNRKQRYEEVKDMCVDLKDLAVQTKLPIVVCAQANREVTSPIEMHNQKIAEGADLERIANKILFIWNSRFGAQKDKDSQELREFLQRTGLTLNKEGKIYAKLTKNRGGAVGLEAVLDFNGNTGVIAPNTKPTEQQGNLFAENNIYTF